MKTSLFPLLLTCLCGQFAVAQSTFYVRNGCGVDDAVMGQNHYIFDPSDEAVQIIKIIMDANLLDPNFTIKSGDVDNALATVDKGNRYIIYNTTYVERIKNRSGTDWAAYFVFAHEIAHHLSNHRFDLTDPGQSRQQELKADIYAGGMLYRLGASLDEAQAGVSSVCKERESNTHPPRRARMEAVASGWKKAKDMSGGAQPERVAIPEASTKSATKPTSRTDNMVFVEGGTFEMGSNSGESDEKPVHSVTVSSYYIGRTEVTQAEWRKVMGSNPSSFSGCDNCPVENVSWNDVQKFIEKLNSQTDQNYRLPTEAEWEYAARGGNMGKGYTYSGSDNIADVAWYKDNSGSKTHPVAQKKANELGLFDMSGNVWEWCSDWYGSYGSGPVRDPAGADSGVYRVFRGCSWFDSPAYCRSAYRGSNWPSYRDDRLGFRLARQF